MLSLDTKRLGDLNLQRRVKKLEDTLLKTPDTEGFGLSERVENLENGFKQVFSMLRDLAEKNKIKSMVKDCEDFLNSFREENGPEEEQKEPELVENSEENPQIITAEQSDEIPGLSEGLPPEVSVEAPGVS